MLGMLGRSMKKLNVKPRPTIVLRKTDWADLTVMLLVDMLTKIGAP